jgi:hypothetical protein
VLSVGSGEPIGKESISRPIFGFFIDRLFMLSVQEPIAKVDENSFQSVLKPQDRMVYEKIETAQAFWWARKFFDFYGCRLWPTGDIIV